MRKFVTTTLRYHGIVRTYRTYVRTCVRTRVHMYIHMLRVTTLHVYVHVSYVSRQYTWTYNTIPCITLNARMGSWTNNASRRYEMVAAAFIT
jgi:hypothetical protein